MLFFIVNFNSIVRISRKKWESKKINGKNEKEKVRVEGLNGSNGSNEREIFPENVSLLVGKIIIIIIIGY